MNKNYFTGRTTKDLEMRYAQGDNPMAIGRFSLAVDSGYGDKKKTNFFNMTVFGKTAENMEKMVKKGTKILVECEANQNQYKDKNGNNVNTVDFIVKSFEFCESKGSNQQSQNNDRPQPSNSDGFMNIPDNLGDEGLPFN